MRAGELDRSLILIRRDVGSNALGEPTETFTVFATARASKTDISDGEKVRAQQVGAEITARFQVYWSPNWATLNPKDRLICDGREYDVVGVKEIGRRDGIEITACARADQNSLYS